MLRAQARAGGLSDDIVMTFEGDTPKMPLDGDRQAKAAVGAVAYAVTKGDLRAVQDFAGEDISAVIV